MNDSPNPPTGSAHPAGSPAPTNAPPSLTHAPPSSRSGSGRLWGLILVGFALFTLINIFAGATLKSARIDLTENRLHTLSDGTVNILRTLNRPIHLRLFVSSTLVSGVPEVSGHVARVQDLLEEYARVAGDQLDLEIFHPEPFSPLEDQAMESGLRGISLGRQGGAKVYFGLVGRTDDGAREALPFFVPAWEKRLEYDLTALIHRLNDPDRPVIGILSTLPLEGTQPSELPNAPPPKPSWSILREMQRSFETRFLELQDEVIDPEIDLLMVVHPKDLSDPTWHMIEQFAFQGRPVLIFTDPNSLAEENATPWLIISNPKRIFSAWGIIQEEGRVAADLRAAKRIRYNHIEMGSVLVNYPVWMDLTSDYLNRADPITAGLDLITVATAGVLTTRAGGAARLTPLLTTSDAGARFDVGLLGPTSTPDRLNREYRPEGRFTLAARISGALPSAFPEGRPIGALSLFQTDRMAGHLATPRRPINMVLVADADLLQDQFWVRQTTFLDLPVDVPYTANGRFVLNILDDMLDRDELISARNQGRSAAARPFLKLQALRQAAELRSQEKQRELNQRLQETQRRFMTLQARNPDGPDAPLTPEQQATVETFRQDLLDIRAQLREVQRLLKEEVGSLETTIKFINIGLAPFLVALAGLLTGLRRRRRGRAAQALLEG